MTSAGWWRRREHGRHDNKCSLTAVHPNVDNASVGSRENGMPQSQFRLSPRRDCGSVQVMYDDDERVDDDDEGVKCIEYAVEPVTHAYVFSRRET